MWLIFEYYIHHIIINIHADDDLMAENMTCLVGTPTNDQTVAQRHGASLDCARDHGEYFGLTKFFVGQ
jgi:hypothetical protein